MATTRLGLMEAYHAVHRFMVHINATPERINEPTNGVVELIGGGFLSRVRIDDKPVSQGAVIALLRAMEEHPGLDPVLFSPIGYTNGAIAFANGRGMALFELSAEGDIEPVTTHARSLMPAEPLGPAFHDYFFDDEHDEPGEEAPAPGAGDDPQDWKPCASCGVTNHPNTDFCANCGTDLTLRATTAPEGAGKMFEERGRIAQQATTAGPKTVRCNACGSHDIALIES